MVAIGTQVDETSSSFLLRFQMKDLNFFDLSALYFLANLGVILLLSFGVKLWDLVLFVLSTQTVGTWSSFVEFWGVVPLRYCYLATKLPFFILLLEINFSKVITSNFCACDLPRLPRSQISKELIVLQNTCRLIFQ